MQPAVFVVIAGAGVALLHTILPDHWMPIAVVARAERWPFARTIKVASWTAVGHVVGSLVLSIGLILLGLGVRPVLHVEGSLVGVILVVTGIGYGLWNWRAQHAARKTAGSHREQVASLGQGEHGHAEGTTHHHDHEHAHAHTHEHTPHPLKASLLIPLGVAASPDPTILPVVLAAAALSVTVAIEALAAYVLVTLGSMVILTVAATVGGYQVKWTWLDEHAGTVTALVLVGLGVASWLAL